MFLVDDAKVQHSFLMCCMCMKLFVLFMKLVRKEVYAREWVVDFSSVFT